MLRYLTLCLCLLSVPYIGAANSFIAIGERGQVYQWNQSTHSIKMITQLPVTGQVQESVIARTDSQLLSVAVRTSEYEGIQLSLHVASESAAVLQTLSSNSPIAMIANYRKRDIIALPYRQSTANSRPNDNIISYTIDGKIVPFEQDNICFIHNLGYSRQRIPDGIMTGAELSHAFPAARGLMDDYRSDNWILSGQSEKIRAYLLSQIGKITIGEPVRSSNLFISRKSGRGDLFHLDEASETYVYEELAVLRGRRLHRDASGIHGAYSGMYYFFLPGIGHLLDAKLSPEMLIVYADSHMALFSKGNGLFSVTIDAASQKLGALEFVVAFPAPICSLHPIIEPAEDP